MRRSSNSSNPARAGDERHPNAVGQAHLRGEPRPRVGVAQRLNVGPAAPDLHRADIGGGEPVLGAHAQHHVERAVQPPAGGVGLDAAAHDAVRAGEVPGQLLGPFAAAAVGGEEAAPGRVEHPGRAGEAGPCHVGGGHADLGRASGVVALAHGAVGEIGPDAAGEAAGNAERPGGAFGVETEQSGGGRGGGEAAAGAGGVPAAAIVVSAISAQGVEDAECDVVAANHRGQRGGAVRNSLRLGDGQNGRNDDRPRMVRAPEVVEFLGMSDHPVDQRGGGRGGRAGGPPDAAWPRGRCEAFRRLQNGAGFVRIDTGQRRAEQIQHQHASVVDDIVGHIGEVEAGGEAGEHFAGAWTWRNLSRGLVHDEATMFIFQERLDIYHLEINREF